MEWYALFYVCLLSAFGLFRVSCSVRAVRMHEMVSKFVVPSSRFPVPSPFFWGGAFHIAILGPRVWHLCPCAPCVCQGSFVKYGVVWLETACTILCDVTRYVVVRDAMWNGVTCGTNWYGTSWDGVVEGVAHERFPLKGCYRKVSSYMVLHNSLKTASK